MSSEQRDLESRIKTLHKAQNEKAPAATIIGLLETLKTVHPTEELLRVRTSSSWLFFLSCLHHVHVNTLGHPPTHAIYPVANTVGGWLKPCHTDTFDKPTYPMLLTYDR